MGLLWHAFLHNIVGIGHVAASLVSVVTPAAIAKAPDIMTKIVQDLRKIERERGGGGGGAFKQLP